MGRFSKNVFARVAMFIPAIILLLALPGAIAAGLLELFPVFESAWIIAAAAVLSVAGVFALLYLTGSRWRGENSLQKSIISVGVGMLVAVFTISFYVPQYNPHIGMAGVSAVAKEMAQESSTSNYFVYDIPRAENADVYLGSVPKDVTLEKIKEIIEGNQRGVLIVKQSSLEEVPELALLLEGRERRSAGYFFCITL